MDLDAHSLHKSIQGQANFTQQSWKNRTASLDTSISTTQLVYSQRHLINFFFIVLLFICIYKAWVISPPCPHPLPYHPLHPLLLLPTPSITSRNYFALISNFVEERL
jgi:hypothetical protein